MSEADARTLLNSFPDGMLTIDAESMILAANPAVERLLGYETGELVGRSLPETVIPPDLAGQHNRGMSKFLSSGQGPVIGARIEIEAMHRSGARIPIELCVFLDRERPRERIHAIIRDNSDRVRRTAARDAERNRLQLFLDATTDAWWDARVGGQTEYGSGFKSIVGRAEESIAPVEPPAQQWIHDDDRRRVREAWTAHIDGSNGRYECTYRAITTDGAVRWLRDRGRAVEFALGRPVRIVGTTTDVTEQQAADERLRNMQRLEMLGLLAGGFAHDLNNLLAAIRGQAALAATEPGIVPSAVESLEAIQLATTKARLLTANMMALGKPQKSQIERFVARTVIEEALQIVRPGLPRSIAIGSEFDGSEGAELEMDPGALQQLVLNLVLNARDAMPQGGQLRVSAIFVAPRSESDGRGTLELVVEDSGVGIPPEVLERMFEPFFTTKPKGIGTGLGLAVVHQVVASAGGTLAVRSDVGRGTRFTIQLPVAGRASESASNESGARHLRVVVIERDALLRAMLSEALRAEGHEVLAAGTPAEAREWVGSKSEPPDALVLDNHAPALDAPRFHARAEEALGRPIAGIFMNSDGALAAAPRSSTRTCVLSKPFEVHDLLSALKRTASAVSLHG